MQHFRLDKWLWNCYLRGSMRSILIILTGIMMVFSAVAETVTALPKRANSPDNDEPKAASSKAKSPPTGNKPSRS